MKGNSTSNLKKSFCAKCRSPYHSVECRTLEITTTVTFIAVTILSKKHSRCPHDRDALPPRSQMFSMNFGLSSECGTARVFRQLSGPHEHPTSLVVTPKGSTLRHSDNLPHMLDFNARDFNVLSELLRPFGIEIESPDLAAFLIYVSLRFSPERPIANIFLRGKYI